jgi:hypothetical protein
VPCHANNVKIYIAELVSAGVVSACQDKKGGRGKCNTYSFSHKQESCFSGNFAECQLGCVKGAIFHSPLAVKERETLAFTEETSVKHSPLEEKPRNPLAFSKKSSVNHSPFVSTMSAPLTASVACNDMPMLEVQEQEQKQLLVADSPSVAKKGADKNKDGGRKKPAPYILSATPDTTEKPQLKDIATLPENFELAKVIGRYLALNNPRSKNKVSDKELEMLTTPLVIKSGPNMGKKLDSLLEAFQKHPGAFEKFLTPAIMGELLKKHNKYAWWKTVVDELSYAFKSGELFRLTGYTMRQDDLVRIAATPVLVEPISISPAPKKRLAVLLERLNSNDQV